MDFITPELTTAIAQAFVALLGTLVSAFVAVAVRYIRTKTTSEQFEYIQHAASVIVSATEQLGINGVVASKKDYAMAALAAELKSRGINLTPDQLEHAIEAAVMDGFNTGKTDTVVEAPVSGYYPAAQTFGTFSGN